MHMLSGLDASFLYLETPQMPMHVGALHLLELPAGYSGDFLADLRRHMASRLPLAPTLRRKLAFVPMNLSNPAWVDDAPDIDKHVVGIRLRRGSGMAELQRQVGLLHPVLLERDRPLWKFHLFEGLRNGPGGEPRYALYSQLHHAAVDGQAAVALAQVILDLTPQPSLMAQAPQRAKRGQLGVGALLRGALANQFEQVGKLVKALPSALGAIGQMAGQGAGGAARDSWASLLARATGKAGAKAGGVRNLGLAPRTQLNATASAGRAFAAVSLPLDELNTVRRRHQASLNDAVLMVCSGALRRYFLEHGRLPRKSLVAAVPISLRAKGDTASNNQASITLVSLGTQIADPAARLAHVLAASAAMKHTLGSVKSVLPTDFPSMGIPWLLQGMSALASRVRVAEKLPALANVVISNVPGSPVPLYMAGARIQSFYPTSIVTHGLGLNITVQSYQNALDLGLMACADAMPDVSELAVHVRTALAEFQALGVATVAPAPASSRGTIAPPRAAAQALRRRTAAANLKADKPPARRKAAVKPVESLPKTTRASRVSAPAPKRSSR